MRRLIRLLPLCALALTLAAPAARAQTSAAPARPSALVQAAAPLPPPLVPEAAPVGAADEVRAKAISHARMEEAEMRGSKWTYPAIGLVVGAVAGAAYGTWVMREADDWVAPPAHFVTVPAGAVLGLALGAVANLVHPR